jgi:hypothetical protein
MGMLGQVGGPLSASQFSTAAGNPLLSSGLLSGATIAGGPSGGGMSASQGPMSLLSSLGGPLSQFGASGGGGGGKAGGQGAADVQMGASAIGALMQMIPMLVSAF